MTERPQIEAALDAVAAGNREAFRLLVRAYAPAVRGYVGSLVRHPDDVDDLVQETFLAAYKHLPAFRRGDDFGAWVRGIARNKVAGHLRNFARRATAFERFRREAAREIAAESDALAAVDDAETVGRLLDCVEKLPDRLRAAVRAVLAGLPPPAVAEQLGTTPGAVYTLCYRANRLLRECLERGGE